ncbi:glycosyltransferase family 2 protein [Silicimonas algicola]|uniref:Glycosyltransferase involved in cell wall biosynthesis n=1 Tax=Silicimonas algicola TaxID=1826607 RepID=A0A316GI36_9RHOB|nr:glycosyltransferase family 2 protein [Silicimonas algicola]AZQ66687.1 glycosyltransferase family 2 protein [Silicimonas algicola]PWK59040.1 glycosyltransferase involved in cell wall biosynthesis [Silicimonas algicola]
MHLIVQIPALNEEETLAMAIRAIPRVIPGVATVEVLVIDDGSTDRTVEVAREAGADHILRMASNVGLARAFTAGIEEALALGADIIVNTDADNQYDARDIPALIQPILDREAQIVVGARPISEIESFSPVKKTLQRLGSWVVRQASDTNIPDAPSGYRAYARDAAARLCVINTYTYTLETIIQAGRKRIPITSVPIRVNTVTRPSRLFRSMRAYILRSANTILRVFVIYAPLRFFFTVAAIFAVPALWAIARFLTFYFMGHGAGHIQSLILAAALMAMATVFLAVGVLADLIAANRSLLEDIRARELLRAPQSRSELTRHRAAKLADAS